MDETVKNEVGEEIEHQGEDAQMRPLMLKLEKYRITPDKQLPKMDFLFRLFGKPCFPRRELVAITGKAKSGKTFVSSMLIACCQERDVLSFHRECETPLRVLWYDTEQSDESTQDILKNRIMRMTRDGVARQPTLFDESRAEPPLDIFNVRAVEWKHRRSLLVEAVNMCKPDLVIVDGIRDLVNDINDGVLAQEVMEELLHLATEAECCIACVLHQNKGGEDHNLRGWIGTELMNKAFEIYSCEKMMPQRIFKLEQTQTRKYDIERPMYYEVNDDGLPVTCGEPSTVEGERQSTERLPQMNRDYIISDVDGRWEHDVRRLFLDAMRGKDEIGGAELRTAVCNLANIRQYKFYNKLLKRAQDENVIVKVENDKHIFYQPAPF
jgi:KaiC/GvpD/RAD55 family RecA-like ATPase